jgi:hypothetical protein
VIDNLVTRVPETAWNLQVQLRNYAIGLDCFITDLV